MPALGCIGAVKANALAADLDHIAVDDGREAGGGSGCGSTYLL
ncbi:hypothetical protein RFM98_22730 [Mesorhizobium sp. VK9D]|nr:hypothetical protein [Mesorhizobium sp. VK9D]MDX8455552.1 hypothetical protein [Mesorhizobium sp. VK9D]